MTNSRSARAAIRLVLAPSPALVAAFTVAHAGAAVAAALSALPDVSKILIWLAIVGHWAYRVAADGLRRTPGAADVLAWDVHGGWWIVTRGRSILPARVRAHAFVSPWLTVLPLRVEGSASRTVLIVPDCVDAERFRQLRVRWRQEHGRDVDE